ncbi:putative carbonic anhydrase [Thelohanellus kitauei]|uniref:Putative carbonic anhydrase n=1 Tax=Thelohanellus kitauei TaxID=669202 RepID=A0A0C2IGG7_THEKT|nr:putative carbonic anhydrase [Thelohanellus kitauei]
MDGIIEPDTYVEVEDGLSIYRLVDHLKAINNQSMYFHYSGSLTYPPCHESVKWIVFPDPLGISPKDMRKLRRLKSYEGRICDNFRPFQEIGDRKLFAYNI